MERTLMERVKLFIPLALFVLLSIFLYQGLSKDPNELPSALVGKPVPAFALPALDNPEKIITEKAYKGQAHLINVWATWCPSCKVEHPYLLKLAEMGIPIVGLNYKDESRAALAVLDATGNPYVDNIFDKEGRLGLDLGVYGAPETFIVDAKGIVRYRLAGVIDEEKWASEMAPIFFAE